jgi:hypothetical protein
MTLLEEIAAHDARGFEYFGYDGTAHAYLWRKRRGPMDNERMMDTNRREGHDTANTEKSVAEVQQLTGEPMLQFFGFDHLKEPLRAVSARFASLAMTIAMELPRNPERTVALRKLLEAKDCAVRALL